MFPTPFSIRKPAEPAPLGHACSIRAGLRVGLPVFRRRSSSKRRRADSKHSCSPWSKTGPRRDARIGRNRSLLARLSPATLCYATGDRACPPLSQNSAPQTAEPDGTTADSGPRLRHRGPRSEHARSRRALAWVSPSPSEAVHLFEAPHSHESAPQTAEPDGATADSGPRL